MPKLYSLGWQWTTDNPVPLKTQVEIISRNLAPLLDDKSFQENQVSFYITRLWLTNVRLFAYVAPENIQTMTDVVLQYSKNLVVNARDWDDRAKVWKNHNNGFDGLPSERDFQPGCDTDFYLSYLNDIAKIGMDIHKTDTASAIRKAVEVSFVIKPAGPKEPKDELHQYFREASFTYRAKSEKEIGKFWGPCGFRYISGDTEGAHFYYNLVMGLDLPRYNPQAMRRMNPAQVTAEILKTTRASQ